MKITKENATLNQSTGWWQTKNKSYQDWFDLVCKFKKLKILHSFKCEIGPEVHTLWVEGDMSCLNGVSMKGDLKVSGNLYVSGSLNVGGSLHVGGFVIVDGSITVGGEFTCYNRTTESHRGFELAVNCGSRIDVNGDFRCSGSARALLGLKAPRIFINGNFTGSFLNGTLRSYVHGELRAGRVASPKLQATVLNVEHFIASEFVKCKQWVSGAIKVGTGSKWETNVYKDGRIKIGCGTKTIEEWSTFFKYNFYISSDPKKYPQDYAIVKGAFMVALAYYEHVVPNIESNTFTIDQ